MNRRTPVLHAKSDDAEENSSGAQPEDDGAMSDADLKQQKLALENMLKGSAGDGASSDTNAPVLTTSRKQRLEREIELLKRLDPEHPENNEYSDLLHNQELVVTELWSIWYSEKGPMNERRLKAIEETLMDPDLWGDAEEKYLALISEHCGSEQDLDLSNWVEPANRLATLYFLMERFKESKQWCERILSAKPWHIGALSGIVMVCMKMGDKEGVLKYSVMGLPNLTPQMRGARKEWVAKNVEVAEKNLSRLEELNRKAYGEPDEGGSNYAEYSPSQDDSPVAQAEQAQTIESSDGEEEDSAWQ